mgnify:CR=1 FL=1
MPRPPLLPVIDWQELFEAAKPYEDWIALGEIPEHRERMESARRALTLPPVAAQFLKELTRPVHVVAIAEDWCGDVVRHVPVLVKLADVCPFVRVRFIARADRLDVFERYLTNGGEAIPKFIFLNDQFVECGNWGPMPERCREWIARGKACGDVGSARRLVADAYQADTNRRIVVEELLRWIDIASSTSPDPRKSLWNRLTSAEEGE